MAELSTCNQKHGAIIIKGGRTLAVGINRTRNHPDHVPDPKTQAAVHAEVAAIRACGDTNLKGATLYVARVGTKGQQMMSAPCENCQKALKAAGIRKVFYTVEKRMDLD